MDEVYLLLAAITAFTAQTGSLVSPTRKVTSQSSGILAKNPMSCRKRKNFIIILSLGSSISQHVRPCIVEDARPQKIG